MSFQMMDDDVQIISKLGDEPNEDDGLSAPALKAKFDEAATLLKAAHNALVGALNAANAAESVGFDSDDIDGENVKDAMENLRTYLLEQMQDVTQGSVADGSVTTAKLDDDAVTGAKVAAETLRETVAGSTAMHLISTEATSATNKLNLHYIRSLGMVLVDGSIEIVLSAVGRQVSSFGFTSYAPVFSGTSCPSVFTTDGNDLSWVSLAQQNGTVKLFVAANGIESAEIGETRTIPVFGWYFCDGEGS